MQKVLLSAYECDPYRGSEYGLSWSWVMAYITHGYEVWCITSLRSKAGIEKFLDHQELGNFHLIVAEIPAFLESRYGKSTIWVYLHYWLWMRKTLQVAKEVKEKISFDLVHHVSWGSIQQATNLWKLDIPLVIGPLGGGQFPPKGFEKYFLDGWSIEVKRLKVSKALLYFNPNTRKAIQKAEKVLVVNNETAEIAKSLQAKEVTIIVDSLISEKDLEFQNRTIKDEIRLLWVVRLLHRKGLPLVLEALTKVPAHVPFSLTVVGDGPIGEQLPGLLQKHSLENKVRWLGQVPFAEVKNAYRSHDALFFCSLRDSNSTQFLEAMANALPIITLNIHGGKVIVPDQAGVKVEVENPTQVVHGLAQGIEKLYSDKAFYQRASQVAFDYAKSIATQDKIKFVLE